jgi:hypothetical protein
MNLNLFVDVILKPSEHGQMIMKPSYTFDENLGKQLDLIDSIISFIYQMVVIFLC